MLRLYISDSDILHEQIMPSARWPLIPSGYRTYNKEEEEEEEFYKLLPANQADHLCQLWQSCSDLHKIQTVYDIVENPHPIRLSKK